MRSQETRFVVQQEHGPGFSALLHDNAKTAAETGAMTVGIPAAIIGGITSTIVVVSIMTGIGLMGCLTCQCVAKLIPTSCPTDKAFGAGSRVVGYPAAAVGSAIAAFFLTLPFALIAQKTRQFKSNQDIQLSLLDHMLHIDMQKELIKNILLAETKQHRFLKNWHSYSSSNLLRQLRGDRFAMGEKRTHQEKWSALCDYMNDQTKDGYFRHNGKKTFNLILEEIRKLSTQMIPLKLPQSRKKSQCVLST